MRSQMLRRGPILLAWADAPQRAAGRTSGRMLLRLLVEAVAPGSDPLIERRCPRCGAEDHGRLHAPHAPVVLSASHAEGLVVVAAVHIDDAATVGVDVEALTGRSPLDELAPLFAPASPPTVAGWTRIEAVLKADGRGLRVAPGDVRFAPGLHDARLPSPLHGPGGSKAEDVGTLLATVPGGGLFEVVTLDAIPGTALSIAIDAR
ncbi:4'-phosphopantetheinyl transferase [Microbacterium resistens]|uniref:4'-phosphopantetheinyl transferase n=1 Tax=Microbacterium resistens TaxID=156977 RepID=A0ABU1SBI7_9MICO|nr:hypothetical protein [Microbacterium resistens]MDR6866979.1 4'-phosphopantetheinyl transferase [Microbacterium resistens]